MKLGIAGPIEIEPFRYYLGFAQRDGAPLPHGLGGTVVSDLGIALLDRGWQVTIFTLDPTVSSEVILEGPGLKICVGPYRPSGRARDFFALERAYLTEAIRREKPELIHAHWTYEYALGALESGIPTLVTAHDAPLRILRLMPTPYRMVRTLMAFRVTRRTRYMTAVSPYVALHMRKVLRYSRPIIIIPNCLPGELFDLGRKFRKRQGEDVTFATVLTGWSKLKNGKTAIEAFSHVQRAAPGSRMIMFGPGYGYGEQAMRWAAARGLTEGVEFAGNVPRYQLLSRLAKEVDVLVHPSLEESFCMSIVEALALGIPVIGGRQSGAVPWILENGTTGVLVDIRSHAHLADVMHSLARDSEKRNNLGLAGRESAKRRFRVQQVVRAYEELYKAMTQERAN